MFNQKLGLGLLRNKADNSYTRRVFDLYLKRHQDELLGLGYHHYRQSGRGCLEFACGFRSLFFGKGFYPSTTYRVQNLQRDMQPQLLDAIATYEPETEVVVYLKVTYTDLECWSRISKNGLALSVLHRQYLNRLLNQSSLLGPIMP